MERPREPNANSRYYWLTISRKNALRAARLESLTPKLVVAAAVRVTVKVPLTVTVRVTPVVVVHVNAPLIVPVIVVPLTVPE